MHDIVVVGGSAGALEGIVTLVQGLPASLKASVHVVMHSAASGLAFVPDILQGRSSLKVRVAQPDESIRHGTVYLPPPDHHLMLRSGRVIVNRGPKQNRFRPAIDPLFTSAAAAYGPRAVGILLSGLLDDGVHGLNEIRKAGGKVIVQSPEDAPVPILPLNAIRAVPVDHVVAASRMSGLVEGLTRTPASKRAMKGSAETARARETAVLTAAPTAIPKSPPSPFTCPDCDGSLWQVHGLPTTYTCHVGHRFTASSLLAGQKDAGEGHLWRTIRSLEEQAEMHRRWAVPRGTLFAKAEDFKRHASVLEQRALILRRILIERSPNEPPSDRDRAPRRRNRATR